MSIMDWFKSEASWREKATVLAARLGDTEAGIGRLRGEASALVLDAGLGNGTAEKRVGEIEREIATLFSRQGWQRQALAEAEAKAAADDAAAEAERQRRAAEAHARRIVELRTSYERAIAAGESATDAAGEAWAAAARIGGELAAEIGTDQARRLLHPGALRERITVNLWCRVQGWLHYGINFNSPEGNFSPSHREAAIVAGLLDGEKKPVALLSNDDDDEPRAAE
jgi:hypothetical protein